MLATVSAACQRRHLQRRRCHSLGYRPSQSLASDEAGDTRRTQRLLRLASKLVPGEEGREWLAEVASCLAEATDRAERRRYLRSYCRSLPLLLWTIWVLRLRGTARRELR